MRNSPIAINDDRNKVGKISKGAEVELLDKSVPSQDMHLWYKVRYNRQEAYVVADEAEDDYDFNLKEIEKIKLALENLEINISMRDYIHILNSLSELKERWITEEVLSEKCKREGVNKNE